MIKEMILQTNIALNSGRKQDEMTWSTSWMKLAWERWFLPLGEIMENALNSHMLGRSQCLRTWSNNWLGLTTTKVPPTGPGIRVRSITHRELPPIYLLSFGSPCPSVKFITTQYLTGRRLFEPSLKATLRRHSPTPTLRTTPNNVSPLVNAQIKINPSKL